MPRSRSFTRLTMRVGLLHLGQSVDFVVSITFLRSPVLAILAIAWVFSFVECLCSHAQTICARLQLRGRKLAPGVRRKRDSLLLVYPNMCDIVIEAVVFHSLVAACPVWTSRNPAG